MHLYVVRHGLTSWNVEGRIQGHSDISLNEAGLEQAHTFARHLEPRSAIRHVFSSDLARCRETSAPLVERFKSTLQIRPVLREISFGAFEGRLDHEILAFRRAQAIEQGIPERDVVLPDAETHQQIWDRLIPLSQELQALNESAIVVTHGVTGSILVAQLVRGTLDSRLAFRFGNTGFYEFERHPRGHLVLLRCNDTSHLEAALPEAIVAR